MGPVLISACSQDKPWRVYAGPYQGPSSGKLSLLFITTGIQTKPYFSFGLLLVPTATCSESLVLAINHVFNTCLWMSFIFWLLLCIKLYSTHWLLLRHCYITNVRVSSAEDTFFAIHKIQAGQRLGRASGWSWELALVAAACHNLHKRHHSDGKRREWPTCSSSTIIALRALSAKCTWIMDQYINDRS